MFIDDIEVNLSLEFFCLIDFWQRSLGGLIGVYKTLSTKQINILRNAYPYGNSNYYFVIAKKRKQEYLINDYWSTPRSKYI